MGDILVREGEMWRYIGGIKNPNPSGRKSEIASRVCVVVRGRGLETLGSMGLTVFGVVSEDLRLRVSWERMNSGGPSGVIT
jgi:hypothetical protein